MSEQLSTATVINFRIARERRMRAAPVASQGSECRPKFKIDNPVMVTLEDGSIVHTRVGDIMTRKPKTIGPESDIRLAAQEMLYLEVHRLMVVEGTDLVGIISQSDIVRAVANGQL